MSDLEATLNAVRESYKVKCAEFDELQAKCAHLLAAINAAEAIGGRSGAHYSTTYHTWERVLDRAHAIQARVK